MKLPFVRMPAYVILMFPRNTSRVMSSIAVNHTARVNNLSGRIINVR